MVVRGKPPVWFWVVGMVLFLWGLTGVAGFVIDRLMTPAMLAQMSAGDRQMRAAQPGWTVIAYGVGTVAGLLGTIALLLRRRDALVWYAVSLVGVVVLFGYLLGATDLVARKGWANAAGLPLVILVLCLAEIALARHAVARGWIG